MAHKTSLNPQTVFIEVHVPSQLSERPCIFVLGVPILPPPTFLLLDFMTVPTSWYLFIFFNINIIKESYLSYKF